MSSDSSPTQTYGSTQKQQQNQSDAVEQLQKKNTQQDDAREALKSANAVDRFIANRNPFSPDGFVSRINRNHRDKMIEAVAQGGEPIFDNAGQIQGVQTPVKGLFGLDQFEYVGNPDYNINAGYDQNVGNVGGNYGQVLGAGADTPTALSIANTPAELDAYYGQGAYDPRRTGSGGDNTPMSELDQARSARADALRNKQSELATAFGSFTDDYYNDLGTSYSEFNTPLLDTAYDDAVRGIWDGFKGAGLMTSQGLNTQMANLDAQKAIEQQRLKDSANTYSMDQRGQIDKERTKLGEQLSALAGGATDIDSINQQTNAITNFDIAGKINKLKSPNVKSSMDFFSDFNKVPETATADPVATFAGTPSQVSQSMMGTENPYQGLGIQTPYSGSSTKVIT